MRKVFATYPPKTAFCMVGIQIGIGVAKFG